MNISTNETAETVKKNKYERPKKWAKLAEEFDLRENQYSEVYLLPLRVASEPYVRSFQYKVLNSILYSNELLYKIGYVSNPNCSFCQATRETINHILFECSYSKSFWSEVLANILNKLGSCGCLSLRDVIIGILKHNNSYLWTCKQKAIKPNPIHFKIILEKKQETETYIAFNSNKIDLFDKKWKLFKEVL